MLVRKRNKLLSGEFIAAAIWDVVLWTAIAFVALSLIGYVKADYVIKFESDSCTPCQLQKPLDQQLIAEGYDLRCVDAMSAANRPLKAYYRISRWPTYVYVFETPTNDYDSGLRLPYPACHNLNTLRAFCASKHCLYAPPVANTVRFLFGVPPIVVAW